MPPTIRYQMLSCTWNRLSSGNSPVSLNILVVILNTQHSYLLHDEWRYTVSYPMARHQSLSRNVYSSPFPIISRSCEQCNYLGPFNLGGSIPTTLVSLVCPFSYHSCIKLSSLASPISILRGRVNGHHHHHILKTLSAQIHPPSAIWYQSASVSLRSPRRGPTSQLTPSAKAIVIPPQQKPLRRFPWPTNKHLATEPRRYQGLPRLCNNKDTNPCPATNTNFYHSTKLNHILL